MGTRHLVAVVSDGAYRIAQYGQWDGYPGGQGVEALAFCREHLSSADRQKSYAEKLKCCQFVDGEAWKQLWREIGVDPDSGGETTVDESRRFSEAYPFFSRDHGARILSMVRETDRSVVPLRDQSSFAADGLFCEWAYVVDLDKQTFEVYKGFQSSPPPAGERFADMKPERDNGYSPVHLARQWKLDDLPSKEAFLAALEDEDEDEDE